MVASIPTLVGMYRNHRSFRYVPRQQSGEHSMTYLAKSKMTECPEKREEHIEATGNKIKYQYHQINKKP